MAKEKIINIRVDAELKKQAKKLADNDGRSLSNWILRLIQQQIELSGDMQEKKKEQSFAESSDRILKLPVFHDDFSRITGQRFARQESLCATFHAPRRRVESISITSR